LVKGKPFGDRKQSDVSRPKDMLLSSMDDAIAAMEGCGSKDVVLLHHNDTDGLSSAAILLRAFTDCGYGVERYSLEKPYPQILQKIFRNEGRLIVFSDFAGKIAPLISELNRKRNLVLIIDHHPAEKSADERVLVLDGMLFGLKGDLDISASATAYLFAGKLLEKNGLESASLSHLGVLGAVGDGFLLDGSLTGVNRELLVEALDHGSMRAEESEQGERYFITISGKEYPALEICRVLDTLGGVGYYDNGPEMGIDLCLKGMDDGIRKYAESLGEKKERIFSQEIRRLKEQIHQTEHIQWFDVEERFEPMGVKMIGVFCTQIKDMDFVDGEKYLAGFQRVPDRVPGFGHLDFNSSKISMRVSREMTDRIRDKETPGLNSILPEATEALGGFSDACHSLSAATTIESGREEELIQEVERVLMRLGGKGRQ
jgi:hypothetical protein